MEEVGGKRINEIRLEQALSIGANRVITACPYCLQMLENAIERKTSQPGEAQRVTKESFKILDIAEIIEKRVGPIIQKRRESREIIIIQVHGKPLPLNPYVRKVIRNVLFALISTLKGVTINGNEDVQITVTSQSKSD